MAAAMAWGAPMRPPAAAARKASSPEAAPVSASSAMPSRTCAESRDDRLPSAIEYDSASALRGNAPEALPG